MSVDGRPDPVRSCLGCRERRGRPRLVRIVSRDGRPDIDGPSNGRGAWLCRSDDGDFVVDGACLAAAIDRRAFARAWRREVSADEVATIRHALLREGDAKERGAPDAH